MISQSRAKLWPDIVKFCNVMASYGQNMPRYAKFILYITSFSSFYQHNISFEPKVFWSQISLATTNVRTQKNFSNLNFLEQNLFVHQFFLTKPFGNFVEHSKFYLTPISFMQHFCGLKIFATRFFKVTLGSIMDFQLSQKAGKF